MLLNILQDSSFSNQMSLDDVIVHVRQFIIALVSVDDVIKRHWY